jgi:hypothetical protein
MEERKDRRNLFFDRKRCESWPKVTIREESIEKKEKPGRNFLALRERLFVKVEVGSKRLLRWILIVRPTAGTDAHLLLRKFFRRYFCT